MRAFCLLSGIALAVAKNDGLGRLPPMGWNTWCTGESTNAGEKCGNDVCNETEIKSVATAIIDSGLFAVGWNRINLDDCWEDVARDANGDIQPDPTRFPSGMKSLGDWLHARNFSYGIYTSLGYSVCNLGGHKTHPPGSVFHEAADALTFARWDVDYLKGDWCDPRDLDIQNQTGIMAAAVAAAGRPMWFMFHCKGTWAPWCAEDGDSSRVYPDHFDYWRDPKGDRHGTSDAIHGLGAVGVHAGLQPDGGFWWPDWDLMMIGGQGCNTTAHCPGQTDVEYRSEFSFWTLASSPLLFATDPRVLTPIMQEVLMNTELIAVNQDPNPRPSMGAVRVSTAACGGPVQCELWLRKGATAAGPHYVILFNPNDAPAGNVSFGFSWATVGIPAGTSVVVRDLWKHADLGVFTGTYTTAQDIVSHEARTLKLTPQ